MPGPLDKTSACTSRTRLAFNESLYLNRLKIACIPFYGVRSLKFSRELLVFFAIDVTIPE